MLLVQHNCRQEYESIIMALETKLSIKAGIIMIQELFISNCEILHNRFNFYWLQNERKNIKVMTSVRKTRGNKIVVDHRTNLINHHYVILLEIQELDSQSKKNGRKTRIVNAYDNQIGRSCIWYSKTSHTRRALKDINQNLVIQSQVLIAGDMNMHSLLWNHHCYQR